MPWLIVALAAAIVALAACVVALVHKLRASEAKARLLAEDAARDVTERKRAADERTRLEAQLRQAQKMEAIGQLAGGVAHDYNNLLAVILNYTDFCKEQLPASHQAQRDLAEVSRAAERAASLTRQLLAFSRRQVVQPKSLDLSAVVADVCKMVRRLVGEDIQLVTELASDLRPIKADPGQIEQILLNLVVNARDAMPSGGKLTVRTEAIELDLTAEQRSAGLKPGSYVSLLVQDTGCGMAPSVVAHIFEPFFTTKEHGKGTGLGLAVVYGIVKQNGGYIEVDSAPGTGTTFRVLLPAATQAAQAGLETSAMARGLARRGSILLVEDDGAVRKLARRILEVEGYRVLEASDPEAAFGVLGQAENGVDLVVTDVVMPKMSGPDLISRLRTTHPQLPVLYLSGYAGPEIPLSAAIEQGAIFLAKPFTSAELVGRVGEALAKTGTRVG